LIFKNYKDAQVLYAESTWDFYQTMAVMRASQFTEQCFRESRVLQEGSVQHYIDIHIMGFLENYPHKGESQEVFGACYLDNLAKFKAIAPDNPFAIFRRAECEAQRIGFEREVAALNPAIGDVLLKLKCQELLQTIAEKRQLPLPIARSK